MEKLKNYIKLHLNIMLFSFTGVLSKLASTQYTLHGFHGKLFYLYIFLMLLNCFLYAIIWQQVIKHFSLSTAYSNRAVYLIWSQIWAMIIFGEKLSFNNILGVTLIFIGVLTVQKYE